MMMMMMMMMIILRTSHKPIDYVKTPDDANFSSEHSDVQYFHNNNSNNAKNNHNHNKHLDLFKKCPVHFPFNTANSSIVIKAY